MSESQETQKMRSVMIAAPSYDGKVDVWHASALSETCKLGLTKGINVTAIYMSYDALVQRARNDIVKLALDSKVDDLVFIDCDQDWLPQDFFKLLEYDVGVVGVPIRKKSDIETYNVKLLGEYKVLDNGLVVVDGVGTGMLRIRKDALERVWEISEEYTEPHKKEASRAVFDVKIVDGELWSEDIVFCKKIEELGEKIYIDPSIQTGHSGNKRWISNFYDWARVYLKKY